jgi:hypothetical protein
MIRSFGDKITEALFRDEFVRQFKGIARPAKRKLEAAERRKPTGRPGSAPVKSTREAEGRFEGLLFHSSERPMARHLQMDRWRVS